MEHLKIAINFISSTDTDEELVRLETSMLGQKRQVRLETSMKGSDFSFDCIYLLHHKCHKINPNRGGSYIDFPD